MDTNRHDKLIILLPIDIEHQTVKKSGPCFNVIPTYLEHSLQNHIGNQTSVGINTMIKEHS